MSELSSQIEELERLSNAIWHISHAAQALQLTQDDIASDHGYGSVIIKLIQELADRRATIYDEPEMSETEEVDAFIRGYDSVKARTYDERDMQKDKPEVIAKPVCANCGETETWHAMTAGYWGCHTYQTTKPAADKSPVDLDEHWLKYHQPDTAFQRYLESWEPKDNMTATGQQNALHFAAGHFYKLRGQMVELGLLSEDATDQMAFIVCRDFLNDHAEQEKQAHNPAYRPYEEPSNKA